MIFLVTVVLLCGGGLALLHLARLGTTSRVADVAVAWWLGSGYYALCAGFLRLVCHLHQSRAVTLGIVVAPMLAWAALRPRNETRTRAVWWPRPLWLFAPVMLYCLVTVLAVAWHGVNTPTHTDDGERVRAYTALVAAGDEWPQSLMGLVIMTGTLSTFVPALGARLGGPIDHFQSNYFVLANLIALVALVVGLGASRGRPERGWVTALLLLSLPLFVYHCTSTYADAVLAIAIAAATVFLLELEHAGDLSDALRALLLLTAAAMVKREGDFVAAPVAVVVVVAAVVRCKADTRRVLLLLGLGFVPYLAYAATKVSLVGTGGAYPFLSPLLTRAVAALPSAPAEAAAAVTVGNGTGVPALFLYALTSSGNAGMMFYALLATAVLGIPLWWRRQAWSLLGITMMLAEATVIALWVYPKFTRDQSTVHRALIPVAVCAAVWIATLVADAIWDQRSVPALPERAAASASA